MNLFGILLAYTMLKCIKKKEKVKNKIPKFVFPINHRSLEKKLKFSREQKKKKKNLAPCQLFPAP